MNKNLIIEICVLNDTIFWYLFYYENFDGIWRNKNAS